ncbi:hypothetical protein N7508_002367 [Penicillium antarcticum]|uniref:uncharacterized protein n=1 Tax=Penicillium antarcticum TaxID=416450 RepID=UPI00239ADE98|nr:uncharacterized protein N7508_002367 [Penicillium antarcticum]KAJ5317859.1 hypothetical protein N7508_002367 [Penicillium antarcticum]
MSVWIDDAGEIWDANFISSTVESTKISRATSIVRLQIIFNSESDEYCTFELTREIPSDQGQPTTSTTKQIGRLWYTLDTAKFSFEERFRIYTVLH